MEDTDSLYKILQRADYWLNYAEVKNVALIGFDFIIIGITVEIIKSLQIPLLGLYLPLVFLFGLFIILSVVVLFASFYPNVNSLSSKKNILSYTDSATFKDSADFLKSFNKPNEERSQNSKYDKFTEDIIDEIIVNSQIASKKYLFFKVALIFTLISIAALIFILMLVFTAAL